ncbi:unnamed protein product [Oppiella nova]|uniref:La-related protein 7 n=1 Tax=Oppiella nova TaxID=334625 RepID=A0A7R9LW47_9ACAR|nr:unnamed protein product [Oppiella nova]CAG2167559.1 unnamed protein product [Oppiella nova]
MTTDSSLPMERHHRKRKKRLLNGIREQIEFYFSDANLRHDRFMRQLIGAEDPELRGRQCVPLNEFLKFNKISEMTQNTRDISLALERSKCLSLNQTQQTVQRVDPFATQDTKEVDELTIYVERLPPTADHQWIRSVFEPFGRIQYIKVPHFRHNHMIMGFAFVEYEDRLSAQKALKHFNAVPSDDIPDETPDHQIDSVSESEHIAHEDQCDGESQPEVSRKRSRDEADDEAVVESKKAKVSPTDGLESVTQTVDKIRETNCETISDKTKEKKKKKRRKKQKPIAADLVDDNPLTEAIHLRVMSKREWKRWKNKYLKLQKQSMASLKRSLLVKTEDNTNRPQMESESTQEDNQSSDRSYESGLIIRLNFTVSSLDFNESEFKRNIRSMAESRQISYIDLPKNHMIFKDSQTLCGVCYVRTNSADDCQRLIQLERLKQMGDLSVLEGNEESEYWNQIFDERIKRKSNPNPNNKSKHKTRGFDRIINRAENVMTSVEPKLNKHIKFDT